MEQKKLNTSSSSTYRVVGLTCADCAQQFENNIMSLEGVVNAQVNFAAEKLTVIGDVSMQDIEEAGKFDNLKLYDDDFTAIRTIKSFWSKQDAIRVGTCTLLLFLGILSDSILGHLPIISLVLYSIIILFGGHRLYLKGLKQLIKLKFDMNSLMTIAIIGAAIIGEWREAAIVVILFVVSEALERYAMNKARYSMQSLISLAPKEATILRDEQEIVIPIEQIVIEDISVIKPGQNIAMDGVIVYGYSTVNQATITGESIPVEKEVGDLVYAGTLNENGVLHVKVTKLSKDSTLAKVIQLVEDAQTQKAPTQAFIDKFASYYTPIIIGLAAMIAILPPLLLSGDWYEWIYRGLSLLVIGCPCALVISTPMTLVTAIGHAAKNGVLIKGGLFLEEMDSLQAVAFDKTGTLTSGIPYVTDIVSLSYMTEHKALKIAATIEKNSNHPLARAIVNKANKLQIYFGDLIVQQFHSFTGNGLQATIENVTYYIGSPHWLQSLHPHLFDAKLEVTLYSLQKDAKTVVLLATADSLLLAIGIADEVRANAKSTIQALHQLGINETILLTGDNHTTAKIVSEQVGIRVFQSDLLPEHKLDYIKSYQKNHLSIAMIGDGVNDAPSLATADVGIAMGGAGSDIALETAQIVLMSDDLSKLPFTIQLSRMAMLTIKQNIAISLSLKLVALLLLMTGMLSMWGAIVADMGATLLVLLNSLRLIKIKP